MNVAEYVIERLAREGITHCFTLYGGAIADLIDALPGRMEYVVCQHEQACGFAAEGFAKSRGSPGLVIATSGPGGGNIVTPLQNAYYDSVPLIALTGQVSTAFMRPAASGLRQLGFQETPITEIVRPITKYAHTPTTAEGAIHALEEALYLATHQRPGPVLLDLPVDVQRLQVDAGAQGALHPEEYPDPTAAARQFRVELGNAKRPGILVGGGAHRARQAILAFALQHSIPVFRTWNALDVVTDEHPCYGGTVGTYGGPGRNFGIQNTDLLLVLGCRLSGRITGGVPESFARGAKLYVVDVDAGLLDPAYQPRKADVNVHCSAERFFDELA